jgi:hypothetical protein
MHKVVMVVLLSATAISAQAAGVYRCQGADGSTVFSDRPCGNGGQQQQIEVEEQYTPGPSGLRESERRLLQRIERREDYRDRRGDYREDTDRMYDEFERIDNRAACRQLDRQRAREQIRPADYTYQRRALDCP